MGLSSWVGGCAFSWRIIPTAFRIKVPLESWNYQFIMLLVSIQKGHILESSTELTEDELRTALAENYGESESQIEIRIGLAKAHPGI